MAAMGIVHIMGDLLTTVIEAATWAVVNSAGVVDFVDNMDTSGASLNLTDYVDFNPLFGD